MKTERTLIKGSRALAKAMGVGETTVWRWRKDGILKQATVSEYRRVIIYDLDMVYRCLNYPSRTKSRM